MNEPEFLEWERKSKDAVDYKAVYADIAGDHIKRKSDPITGLVLSQIIYWYMLPGKNNKSKLKVTKEGRQCLAKTRYDWHKELRISPKQADRALNILEKKGIIDKRYYRFNGLRTIHIYLSKQKFFNLLEKAINTDYKNPHLTKGKTRTSQKVNTRTSQKVKAGVDKRVTPLTETTTKNTAESTPENTFTPLPSPLKGGNALLSESLINALKNKEIEYIPTHIDIEGKIIKNLAFEKARQQAALREKYPEVAHTN